MRKALIFSSLVTLFFFLLIPSFAQKIKRSFSYPRIELSEESWDFGHVPKDLKVSHIFMIRNSGTDTLVITRVRSDCGCTHTPLSKSRVPPNQTAELELIFNPHKFRGQISKAVSIVCNDTVGSSTDIAFFAHVGLENPMVKVNPQGILFGELTSAQEITKKLRIRNTSGREFSISVVQNPGESIVCRIEKTELLPDESTEIYFQTNPPLPTGLFRTSLTLDFTGLDRIRCTIPIQGTVTR